jgi:hypothetical protein
MHACMNLANNLRRCRSEDDVVLDEEVAGFLPVGDVQGLEGRVTREPQRSVDVADPNGLDGALILWFQSRLHHFRASHAVAVEERAGEGDVVADDDFLTLLD